jgi:hypothetical protein
MVLYPSIDRAIYLPLQLLMDGAPGITPGFGKGLAEAASVCLSGQGHVSPTPMVIGGVLTGDAQISWDAPNDQTRRCWADDDVTTEHGAYGVATLLISEISDLQVVARSKRRTGFDYWLGAKDDVGPLFQGKARLEVSGIRRGGNAAISRRVRDKLKQTQQSDGLLPAIVVVVEFGGPQSRVAER